MMGKGKEVEKERNHYWCLGYSSIYVGDVERVAQFYTAHDVTYLAQPCNTNGTLLL